MPQTPCPDCVVVTGDSSGSGLTGAPTTMNPLLMLIIAEIVRQVPALAIDLVRILSQQQVTEAQWTELKAKYQKPYDQYIAEAQAAAGK